MQSRGGVRVRNGAAFPIQVGAKEQIVKQFLVVRIAESLNQVANLVALPGLFSLEAAQQFIKQAAKNEPESRFLIQEVGTA